MYVLMYLLHKPIVNWVFLCGLALRGCVLHCGLRGYEISMLKISLFASKSNSYVRKLPFSASSQKFVKVCHGWDYGKRTVQVSQLKVPWARQFWIRRIKQLILESINMYYTSKFMKYYFIKDLRCSFLIFGLKILKSLSF